MVKNGTIKQLNGIDSGKDGKSKQVAMGLILGSIVGTRMIPSGKLTVRYRKWPIELVDLPLKNDDFP